MTACVLQRVPLGRRPVLIACGLTLALRLADAVLTRLHLLGLVPESERGMETIVLKADEVMIMFNMLYPEFGEKLTHMRTMHKNGKLADVDGVVDAGSVEKAPGRSFTSVSRLTSRLSVCSK